ncbi:MAG TPA: hypothetical protein VHE30_28715 [Polyangiaceae bacterium]|nr:hypothetical protein [Polyangiaceae bacterium]
MPVSRRSFLRFGVLLAAGTRPARADAARTLGVVVLGPAPPALAMELAERAVRGVYGYDVRVVERRALPKRARYRGTGRPRAEILLEELARVVPSGVDRILGVTAADISTTKPPYPDWGILGLANLGGRTAVVSSARTRRGTHTSREAAQRFGKVVVHELGHSLGLPHCTVTPGCIMEDAGGTVFATDLERDLCATCRGKLASLGHPPDGDGRLPW